MEKKVAIFSGLPGRGSGAERVLEYLLADPLARASIAVVISPKGSAVFDAAEAVGCRVLHWPVTGDSLLAGSVASVKFFRSQPNLAGVETIHAWHTRGFELACALARTFRCFATGTLHDAPDMNIHSWSRRLIIKTFANRLNGLVAVSNALRDRCLAQKWRVPIRTIHNGLPDWRPPQSSRSQVPVQIGFAGLNARWKGIELLEEVIARTTNKNFHWNLFGQPTEGIQSVWARILKRFPAQVTHHGYVRPEIFFPMIDLLFHPSISFDPYPTLLLEAARAGVPVVASAVGGSNEIVDDGRTGLLFPAGDLNGAIFALSELTASSSRLEAAGKNARKKFEQDFAVANMAAGYVEFWRNRVPSSPP